MAQDGSVKEELHCTDCGEENAETSRTTICPDFCKGDEVDVKEEIGDHVPGIERFLEVECVEIKEEPVSFVSPGEDLTDDHVPSPMPEMPVFHTVKVETLCPLKSELEEAEDVPEEMPDSDPDDPIVEEASQTDPLALAPSHSKDWDSCSELPLVEETRKEVAVKTTTMYNCEVCGIGFERLIKLRLHKLTHGSNVQKKDLINFNCATHTPSYNNVPLGLHRGKRIQCNICDKLFDLKVDLDLHERSHINTKKDYPYQCSYCERMFKSGQYLADHIKHSCPITKNKLCSICGQLFKRRDQLTKHNMRAHTILQTFEPSHCKVESKQLLDVNKQVNSAGPKASKKTPRQSVNVRSNLKTYSNDVIFKCPVCEKQFTKKSHRNLHMFAHMNSGKFECNCKLHFEKT